MVKILELVSHSEMLHQQLVLEHLRDTVLHHFDTENVQVPMSHKATGILLSLDRYDGDRGGLVYFPDLLLQQDHCVAR
jgi:hypothetical protein